MRKCEQCGESIDHKPKAQRFCNLSCGQKYNVVRKCPVFYLVCEFCNALSVASSYREKYCNHSCSAKATNPDKGGTLQCARTDCVNVIKSHSKKYCSVACGNQHRSNELVRKWFDGEWDATYSWGLSEPISKYLKEQAGWRCQSPTCAYPGGWSVVNPSTGKVPVQVDHIDGNSDNNRPDNLIVLCPSCHALTPTYGALNIGKGRARRQELRLIKSGASPE